MGERVGNSGFSGFSSGDQPQMEIWEAWTDSFELRQLQSFVDVEVEEGRRDIRGVGSIYVGCPRAGA